MNEESHTDNKLALRSKGLFSSHELLGFMKSHHKLDFSFIYFPPFKFLQTIGESEPTCWMI